MKFRIFFQLLAKKRLRTFFSELVTAIRSCVWGCRSLLSIWGYNLQFYPNFALFSILGGMNLDHDFVQVGKLSKDQKKGLHQKCNTNFFFPEFKWTPALRCTPESNYWGGCRCRPYSNYCGGIQPNY